MNNLPNRRHRQLGVKNDCGNHLRFIYLCHNKSVFRHYKRKSEAPPVSKDMDMDCCRLGWFLVTSTKFSLATIIGLLLLCQWINKLNLCEGRGMRWIGPQSTRRRVDSSIRKRGGSAKAITEAFLFLLILHEQHSPSLSISVKIPSQDEQTRDGAATFAHLQEGLQMLLAQRKFLPIRNKQPPTTDECVCDDNK